MTAGLRPAERRLLRRAARAVAVQTAAAVAAVVLITSLAVLLVEDRQRAAEADHLVRTTVASADDVNDPPPGVWLVRRRGSGGTQATAGAPAAVAALDPATLPTGRSVLERDGRQLLAWTGTRPMGLVSAIVDLSAEDRERHRLLVSLGLAAILGVLGAAAVGGLIGRRAVRPLGRALALQARFVADASHELRTPLAVLLTSTQVLRRHLQESADPRHVAEVQQIVQDAKHLGEVVTDLLGAAELADRPRAAQPVDLGELAEEVARSLQPLAARRTVRLTAVSPGPAVVDGAPAALRRALTSLTDNALAHTGPGGNVRLQVEAAPKEVTVAVVDDGEGLDPSQAARLVQRFGRDTESGAGRRVGLGLALVAEVAHAHGGRLEIDGTPGEGARFALIIPSAGRR